MYCVYGLWFAWGRLVGGLLSILYWGAGGGGVGRTIRFLGFMGCVLLACSLACLLACSMLAWLMAQGIPRLRLLYLSSPDVFSLFSFLSSLFSVLCPLSSVFCSPFPRLKSQTVGHLRRNSRRYYLMEPGIIPYDPLTRLCCFPSSIISLSLILLASVNSMMMHLT